MSLDSFLQSSEFLNFDHPEVAAKANELGAHGDCLETVRRCFEFVRDEIEHSMDYPTDVVTCSASDVLAEGTGLCFAKSHLMVALARANGIPAALGYQRLANEPDDFTLHGIAAVHLQDQGWFRVDPRGPRPGRVATFDPPNEFLAFELEAEGEMTYADHFAQPAACVVKVLTCGESLDYVSKRLPSAI